MGDLLAAAPGLRLAGVGADPSAAGDTPVQVTGVTLDSRRVLPGDLYAALPGANVHGARFAASALESGAVAVLTDEAGLALLGEAPEVPVLLADDPRAVLGELSALVYGRPAHDLTMYGVTGTNGKTTTVYLLEAALRALGTVTGLIGTIEIRAADERLPSVRTTPESSDLHGLLALMRERSVTACCMEVSSHALALHRVDGVRYDVGVFTNLSQDHLDFHGTLEDYYAAKAQLFTPERSRRAVVCVDDEWGRRLAGEVTIPVVTLTSRPAQVEADWRIEATPGVEHFALIGPERAVTLRSALPGEHNRINTSLAFLALLSSGVAAADAVAAIEAGTSVPGRMQQVTLPADAPEVFVDFAHTPDAVAATLAALRPRCSGRLVAVLGAGGDRDPGKRPAMGAAAARVADDVVVTDDNPRHEDPAAIRAAVFGGAHDAGSARVHDVAGRVDGIVLALALAGPEGVVAVLGKGHEQGQTVGDQTLPFDDVEVVAAQWRALAARADDTPTASASAGPPDGDTESDAEAGAPTDRQDRS